MSRIAKEVTLIPLLPEKNWRSDRAIRYLANQGIDPDIIKIMLDQGRIYESKHWHDCVFVGLDKQQQTLFGSVQSTGDRAFARDVDGSVHACGFRAPSAKENSKKLFVFNSPMDLLAKATLDKQGEKGQHWQNVHRLSLSDRHEAGLLSYLLDYRQIESVTLCLSTDRESQRVTAKLCDILLAKKIDVHVKISTVGQSFSEQLLATQKEKARQPSRSHDMAIA